MVVDVLLFFVLFSSSVDWFLILCKLILLLSVVFLIVLVLFIVSIIFGFGLF